MITKVPEEYVNALIRRMRYSNLTLSDVVISAFSSIPRENFARTSTKSAYRDTPLPIPKGQTISAPHMYAIMFAEQISDPKPGMDILEVGTGSGYGAALLAYIAAPGKVYSIERIPELVDFARQNLATTKLTNFELICGDGTKGIPGNQFDRIYVTAAGPKIPDPLIEQLRAGGKLIIPVEESFSQWLKIVEKGGSGEIKVSKQFQVRFVPLIGEEGFNK